jgi:sugar phosphate isomerase/epimerase
MSERDELAEIIQDCGEYIPGSHAHDYVSPDKAADAVLAAGYRKRRTITTAEELDALPNYSVLLDGDSDVWQKRGEEWCSYETARSSSKRIAKYGPMTVLHEPTS